MRVGTPYLLILILNPDGGLLIKSFSRNCAFSWWKTLWVAPTRTSKPVSDGRIGRSNRSQFLPSGFWFPKSSDWEPSDRSFLFGVRRWKFTCDDGL